MADSKYIKFKIIFPIGNAFSLGLYNVAVFPLTLTGENLGQRHRYLNALVNDAFKNDVNFQEIQSMLEQSPIDRIFKIDLASKVKNVDYIIKNLKDNDMLYVSRALKCKWLLDNEFQYVINPENLEQNLYPYMITTAVNKMKWWISINLKNPERCQQFYQYFNGINYDLAIRFLTHCNISFILNEIPKILEKLDPFYFKVFCERSPQVAQLFYDSLIVNEKVLNVYLTNEASFYNSLKVILKADSNIFLDITEKYFNRYNFKRLSPSATRFIIHNCKNRFTEKTELYAAWLLDIKTIAECLTAEECKEVVFKLARAEYLRDWFSFKEIEPLIKRLSTDERSAFKNKIFVKKELGETVRDCPYPMPSKPAELNQTKIFNDEDLSDGSYHDTDYEDDDAIMPYMAMKCCAMSSQYRCEQMIKRRTVLDQLFDEYRFSSFEKTLMELRKKIAAESSPQNRQYMMLVLVSKTGGRVDSVHTLVQLLLRHVNEPSHVRSTIVRSLVKRAFIWRLPQESWESFLKFAVGLGLDGKAPEADCHEGLHAVVLRNLIQNGDLASEILPEYIKEFSTLTEYSLTAEEKKVVTKFLPELLLKTIVSETNTKKQALIFDLLFQTLEAYKLPLNIDSVVPALAGLVKQDPTVAESLITKLFQSNKARRELFKENFIYVSTDASYINALRHDIEVLKIEKYIKRILEKDPRKEQFMRKLAIYFREVNGLADIYSSAIKQSVLSEPNLKLSRALALLMDSKDLEVYSAHLKKVDDNKFKRFAVALAVNAHLAKPKLEVVTDEWDTKGAKAITNQVLICRGHDVYGHLENLLKLPRTTKLAVTLSQRIDAEINTLATIAKIQPNVALKCAIKYFHHNPDTFKSPVWEIVKPLLKKLDFENRSKKHFIKIIWKVDKIPLKIRADYCATLYEVAKDNPKLKITFVLSQIEKLILQVNEDFLENILLRYLQSDFTTEKLLKLEEDNMKITFLYLRILIKHVLASKSIEVQTKRSEKLLDPLLATLKSIWDNSEKKEFVNKYLKELLNTLRFKPIFLNEDYASCLPVFERIVSWMHTILPMDIYFAAYVKIHLNMLYFKSVRQCLKQRPDVFMDEEKKHKVGIDILGRTFGNYIAKEVDELKSRYFDSILELYGRSLIYYLYEFFIWDSRKDEIYAAVIKGIAESGKDTTPLLGVYIFKESMRNYTDSDNSKIIEDLKNVLNEKDNKEIQFFLQSEEYRV